ncbi:hypothetical protein ACH439_00120 [Streptomyces microflavus]|uniref:hypothetical protein n=1 Tax=Streptomyces microflavus TaxID=1919 RepID=UPI0037AA81AB
MTNVVVDLAARRPATSAETSEASTCTCGSGWFELRSPSGSGAVCMNEDGTITGFSGEPHCVECGTLFVVR